MEQISKETVKKIAAMAMLPLTEEEALQTAGDLQRILSYGEVLKQGETETETAEETRTSFFREDRIVPCDCRQELFSQAPDCQDGFYRVPKTVVQEGK